MQTKKSLNITLTILLTAALSACGGGSSSNSNPVNNQSDNKNQDGSDISNNTDNSNKETAIASSILLANDTNLPILENSKPITPLKDKASIQALKEGIYKIELVNVASIGNTPGDCYKDKCPAITKIKLNTESNEIESKRWAYMPIAKQWIELQTDSFITFPESGTSIDISFNQAKKINKNFLSFEYEGQTGKIEISGKETSIANKNYKSTLTDKPATYSIDAKSYQFYGELVDGEIIILNSPNDSGKDVSSLKKYSTLAAFRDAHRNINSPFCFLGNYLVFKKTGLGATEYYGDDQCNTSIPTNSQSLKKSSSYNEYIKNNMIYLNHEINDSVEETSSHQYYWAIDIDGSGYNSSGKALQKGYAFIHNRVFYNESAVIDWLTTKYPEIKESGLPVL